jgi:hypothetical protein
MMNAQATFGRLRMAYSSVDRQSISATTMSARSMRKKNPYRRITGESCRASAALSVPHV